MPRMTRRSTWQPGELSMLSRGRGPPAQRGTALLGLPDVLCSPPGCWSPAGGLRNNPSTRILHPVSPLLPADTGTPA